MQIVIPTGANERNGGISLKRNNLNIIFDVIKRDPLTRSSLGMTSLACFGGFKWFKIKNMNKIEICKKIKKSIRKLVLSDEEQFKSWGTGVIISEGGIILTANHVISDYPKLTHPKIIAYGLGGISIVEYKPKLFNVSLNINMPDMAYPLPIDLAILEPIEKVKEISFLKLNKDIPFEGEDVIMAGFPDEIKPPLNFDRMLNLDNPELNKNRFKINEFFKTQMCLIMIKSGMIGNTQKTSITGKCEIPGIAKSIEANGAVYWIDNASNNGASGGPVVNFSGKLIGIICEKGLTNQGQEILNLNLKVPSGATMALSHNLITWGLK